MIFGIIIEAFGDLRQKEQQINKDKKEICFICGVDKDTLEKKGEKLDVHREKVHNIWTYVDYILGLRFVDIQETNSINSYVIESLEKKELNWFPYDESAIDNTQNNEDDE
jgi:inositol 1,4,5-triphosphate receptor type 1/inositol 1,4,5-triphosphate receptor type 3